MLFFPWRSEETELIYKEQYDAFNDMELERVLQDLQNVDREEKGPFPKRQPLNTLMKSSGL